MAYDHRRVDALRLGLAAAAEELRGIRTNDPAAIDVMRMLASAHRTLAEEWLPRVQSILDSTAMTLCVRSAVGVADVDQRPAFIEIRDPGWVTPADQNPILGPPVPGSLTFDEVAAQIRTGVLIPMAAPVDANGRAGAHYTSLSFESGGQKIVGEQDLTSNLLKVIDFFSDGLPVGWREHHTLTIYYLSNARVISRAHVLNAYDRDDGPETVPGQTKAAFVSGYMAVVNETSTAEVSFPIGPDIQDPTQGFAISQSLSSYSGRFYPDSPPDFQPVVVERPNVGAPTWTFTRSNGSLVEGWGTWGS